MKLISVNVGLPRDIFWRGKAVKSSIWKNPVEGRIRVSTLNLDGDQQSDLSVHGGVDKAIYVYPREHYSSWHSLFLRSIFPGEPSARTSPPRASLKIRCKSEIDFVGLGRVHRNPAANAMFQARD